MKLGDFDKLVVFGIVIFAKMVKFLCEATSFLYV